MVPGTEPATWPSRTITYLPGSGPVAGPAQRNATEVVVDGPAVSPPGRSSGGLFHGAQISRPAIRPSTTAAAATAQIRRGRRAGAPGDGPAAGGGSAGYSDAGAGRPPG